MNRFRTFILTLIIIITLSLVAACNQQPAAPAPGTALTPAATQTAAYVGEKICQMCHKKTNFDKTPHVNSFKPLSDFKLDKTYGTVTVYDGAANDAKSTTVDLSKALGVQMSSSVVAQIPATAGFAKQFYRVGKLVKNTDGTYSIQPAAKVSGTNNWSAEDYTTCAKCHSPGMGKAAVPDNDVTCEACHGPGSLHIAALTDDQRKATMPLPDTNTCLTCHASDPSKDAKTGQIITTNHYGTRDYSMSAHATGNYINGCLTCHGPHGVNASGRLLRADNPNDICMKCHADKHYDVNTIMWKNPSDPYNHITADHSFTAIPLSAMKVDPKTKNMDITDPSALALVKKIFPTLFK